MQNLLKHTDNLLGQRAINTSGLRSVWKSVLLLQALLFSASQKEEDINLFCIDTLSLWQGVWQSAKPLFPETQVLTQNIHSLSLGDFLQSHRRSFFLLIFLLIIQFWKLKSSGNSPVSLSGLLFSFKTEHGMANLSSTRDNSKKKNITNYLLQNFICFTESKALAG